MAATTYPNDGSALPFRVASLERNEVHAATKLAKLDDKVDNLEQAKATFTEQIIGLSATVVEVKAALNRVLWALVTLALTIAGSAVGVMLTLGGPH